jgi:hypothetical protein
MIQAVADASPFMLLHEGHATRKAKYRQHFGRAFLDRTFQEGTP